jgi:Cellulose binding domain
VSTRTSRATAMLVPALFAMASLGAIAGCREADPYFRYGHLPDAAAGDDAGLPGATDAVGPDASESCPTCPLRVLYTCRSNDEHSSSFILDVTNQSTTASITLAALTLRYWFTRDQSPQALDCDTAKVGCTNVTTKVEDVLPPRPGANSYAEIAFSRGALSLDPELDTGDIQFHLHAPDEVLIDADDDYSSLCVPVGVAFPSNRITAYLDGVLVWGLEPPR